MSGFSHCIFLVLTIMFLPFGLVWICCAVSASNRKRKEDMDLLRQLLKEKK